MPPTRKPQRFVPYNPAIAHTAPGGALLRRRQLTIGGDGDPPVRDPRLDAGAVQTAPGRSYALAAEQQFADYTKVPATYVLRFELGPDAFASDSASVNLRPEQFLLRRLTWRCTPLLVQFTPEGGKPIVLMAEPPIAPHYDPASCIEVRWEDEFTKFLGGSGPAPAGLLGALMGEVNGFLDQTREILFAGKQTLSATVQRLIGLDTITTGIPFVAVQYGGDPDMWKGELIPLPQVLEIEFHGIGLLPPGTNYSGGA